MDLQESTQRKSFNPEAAAFSPTPAATMTDNAFIGQEQHQRSTLAAGNVNMPGVIAPHHQMASGQAQMLGGLTVLGPGYAQLMDVPAQHFGLQGREAPRPAGLPDLDELTNSLGLPGAKIIVNAGSPQQSQRNRAQNPTDGRLTSTRAGKLLGRALNQPLTAVSLAAYLKNASNSSEETVTPAHYVQAQLRQDYLEQKIVRPPPGFINQTPRMITAENRLSDAPTPFPQGLAGVPTSYVQHQDLYATPQAASRRSQKQPRRHTRTNKRSDQGPMPSAADIYPDDSDWVRIPFSRTPQRHLAQQTFDQSSPSTRIQVNNPVNWPTPAEVYTPRDPVQNLQVVFNNLQLQQSQHGTHTQQLQQAQPHHHDQKLQSALATFSPPTREDYNALDDEVMSLINELPRLSFTTMANFGALDIDQDTSQTTTTQEDMARYGLTRIGIGADWSGAADAKGSWETPRPFGVRPRDHQGWGGWEWAMRNGWGEE